MNAAVPTRGTVISVHGHGATVRLDDGGLASVTPAEVAAHRGAYLASLQRRAPLDFALEPSGRHRVVFLADRGSGSPPAAAATPSGDAATVPAEAGGSLGRGDAERGDPEHGDPEHGDPGHGEIVRVLRLVGESGLATDPVFEHRIAAYLKETTEWAPSDRPAPIERHAMRKKKRAAFFEQRDTKRRPPG